MNDTIAKTCLVCGDDVTAQKRVKDPAGNYYCHPCWASRQQQQQSNLPVLTALDPEKEAEAVNAHRERRTAITIVGIGSIVGLLIVGSLLYFLFFRGKWERDNRERLAALQRDAQSLVSQGQLEAGHAKYNELFELVGERNVTDEHLQRQLSDAQLAFVEVRTAIAAEQNKRDEAQAKAQRLRNSYAQGLKHEEGDGVPVNYDEAHRLYRLAAEGGSEDGMYRLAGMYSAGRGTKRDPSEAVRWLKLAANAGHGPSLYLLGVMTGEGDGTPKDAHASRKLIESALPILERDATEKQPRSITCLAFIYRDGVSSRGRKPKEAVRLFEEAAAAKDRLAMANLAAMYFDGDGVPKDETKALNWYRRAAEANLSYAAHQMGMMHLQGWGTRSDLPEAVAWFRKATELGSAAGMTALSALYWQGQGVPQDHREAYRLAQAAASLDEPAGHYAVGLYHQQGVGVPVDEGAAMQAFRRAAALGHTEAVKLLAEIEQSKARQARLDSIKSLVLQGAQADYDSAVHKQQANNHRQRVPNLNAREGAAAIRAAEAELNAAIAATQQKLQIIRRLKDAGVSDAEYSEACRQLRTDAQTPDHLSQFIP